MIIFSILAFAALMALGIVRLVFKAVSTVIKVALFFLITVLILLIFTIFLPVTLIL